MTGPTRVTRSHGLCQAVVVALCAVCSARSGAEFAGITVAFDPAQDPPSAAAAVTAVANEIGRPVLLDVTEFDPARPFVELSGKVEVDEVLRVISASAKAERRLTDGMVVLRRPDDAAARLQRLPAVTPSAHRLRYLEALEAMLSALPAGSLRVLGSEEALVMESLPRGAREQVTACFASLYGADRVSQLMGRGEVRALSLMCKPRVVWRPEKEAETGVGGLSDYLSEYGPLETNRWLVSPRGRLAGPEAIYPLRLWYRLAGERPQGVQRPHAEGVD
ncbi:MAG: hypothetical protein COZ06_04765 [Armatimonadetes bacterium CG_4_10_14_3_um_filter_66_18]|nr:hypothetical protein [Armatimonadota bacterium]PIW13410.1 MAG: hypothetical protein COW34_09685 [Armatimonadetes bacterium CG17_big_fil_post_rev_8_21_14_2_50_66_6]PIY51430.1 MAG: hypothetical protein COZ06_04765 [Armatimonadetes bacterium CG_4_10_14_3_um_filter_66_18]PJB63950.1 MAG: hypothetical protein CO096_20505 [Armatimonadetes bacterium CG_4_9_14_3_um_filter_66_14]